MRKTVRWIINAILSLWTLFILWNLANVPMDSGFWSGALNLSVLWAILATPLGILLIATKSTQSGA
jgi:TRAP-type C4-dicarboxylate transport system permease small subunit